jgi:hypothetical protein
MTNDLALIYGGISMVSVAVYAIVGRRLSRRSVPEDARVARDQFSLWWYGLAVLTFLGGVESLLAAVGLFTLQLDILLLDLTLLGFCAAMWGLVGYLSYLYTGRQHLVPLTLLYSLAYVLLLDYVISGDPTGFTVVSGRVVSSFSPASGLAVTVVLVLLLVVPEVAAVLAYLTLLFRTSDRTLRFRIALVGGALLCWFATALVPSPGGTAGTAWGVLQPLVGAIAATVILISYYPPALIQRLFRVGSVDDHPLATGASLPPSSEASSSFAGPSDRGSPNP